MMMLVLEGICRRWKRLSHQPPKYCKIQRLFTILPVYTFKNTVAIKSMGHHFNKYGVFCIIFLDGKQVCEAYDLWKIIGFGNASEKDVCVCRNMFEMSPCEKFVICFDLLRAFWLVVSLFVCFFFQLGSVVGIFSSLVLALLYIYLKKRKIKYVNLCSSQILTLCSCGRKQQRTCLR